VVPAGALTRSPQTVYVIGDASKLDVSASSQAAIHIAIRRERALAGISLRFSAKNVIRSGLR
jgi:hypothetical protein